MPAPTLLPGRKHRGFTLIELMIVVVIIGLLATVAIPEFRNMSLRAKKSERGMMFNAIMRSVNDYWREHNSLPGGVTPDLPQNPPQDPDGSKYAFQPTVGQWARLALRPDGALHFRYDITGNLAPGSEVLFLTGKADLDNDGVVNILTVTYTLQNDVWQPSSELESPNEF